MKKEGKVCGALEISSLLPEVCQWKIGDEFIQSPLGAEKNISQYDWTCDFEKDLCDIQSTEDGIEWRRERKGRVTPLHGMRSLVDSNHHYDYL